MSVKIRLKKIGSKNKIIWRVVVTDAKSPRDGRFIEEIGCYNPLPIEEVFQVKQDRLDYWVSQGAQLSGSVRSLIKRQTKKAKKLSAK